LQRKPTNCRRILGSRSGLHAPRAVWGGSKMSRAGDNCLYAVRCTPGMRPSATARRLPYMNNRRSDRRGAAGSSAAPTAAHRRRGVCHPGVPPDTDGRRRDRIVNSGAAIGRPDPDRRRAMDSVCVGQRLAHARTPERAEGAARTVVARTRLRTRSRMHTIQYRPAAGGLTDAACEGPLIDVRE